MTFAGSLGGFSAGYNSGVVASANMYLNQEF
jgi:hypothetical protein